jgi:WD40-like Beta Propeller Repeat
MKRLRRLRALDEIPVTTSWEDVRTADPTPDASPPAPSRRRRAIVIGVAFGLFAASVGTFLFEWAKARPGPAVDSPAVSSDLAPTSLTIVCRADGATVSTPTVQLGTDGLLISAENPSGAAFLRMRDPEEPERSFAFGLRGASTLKMTFPVAPGQWIVGCFSSRTMSERPPDIPVADYPAEFEVVDPEGHWTSIQDAHRCGGPLPPPAATVGSDSGPAGPLTGAIVLSVRAPVSGATSFVSVAADGSGGQPLFPGLVVDDAVFSPDGSRVALVIRDQGGDPTVTNAALEDSEIYVANADGSGLTRLTDNQWTDDLVRWTPDGTLLSFRSNRGKNDSLYTMRPDGTNVQQITPDTWSADSHDWSQSTGSLVFSVEDGQHATRGCSDNEIYLLGRDGVISSLTHDEWYDQSPRWSPDGSRIAYAVSDQSDYAWEIFTMNADGSDQRRITDYPGYDMGPLWSPDGTMIAFTSDRFRGPDLKGEDQSGRPYVMNADGSGVRPLFTQDQLAGMGIDPSASVSVGDWRA